MLAEGDMNAAKLAALSEVLDTVMTHDNGISSYFVRSNRPSWTVETALTRIAIAYKARSEMRKAA